MDLSIIIVNYNVFDDIKICIESIYKYLTKLKFEIIVIDNNSTDKSVYNINTIFKEVKFIPLNSNNGFGHANNIGMEQAAGRYILLANPDIIFTDNSIEKLYNFLEKNEEAGVVGPVQYKPDVGIEYYYTFFPSIYSRFAQEFRLYQKARLMKKRIFGFLDGNIKIGKPFKVDWVIGSCMMFRSEILRETGGFDEAFFLYEEETEWQFRMNEKGWLSYMHPQARVLHNNHSSTSKNGTIFIHYQEFRSRIIFDHKRLKGIKYIVRVLLIEAGLSFRVIYFSSRYLFSKRSRIKLKAFFDLLKFNSLSCQKILNSRYDSIQKQKLFV